MAKVKILTQYCKGCGLCVEICPKGALETSEEITELGVRPVRPKPGAKCSGCMLCYVVCPDAAIVIYDSEPAETTKKK